MPAAPDDGGAIPPGPFGPWLLLELHLQSDPQIHHTNVTFHRILLQSMLPPNLEIEVRRILALAVVPLLAHP